ncbi:hypothetical protein ACFQ0I_11080 [Mariniflexile aquimaris]|uniref:GDSL-like lipase/acylhydrolase family protein n=1 Tax=Mariniflexile aquimaris TaxID=881009 RepID=A0ABW3BUG2_9FLAO
MKKLFFKMFLYTVLIVMILEVLVRVLHLTKDYPARFVDERGVERWVPNQEGYAVTGNRRQNFSKFHINSSGYNSYRDFKPSKERTEIAIVGDSYIEGFHQDYDNSIGKKIESKLHDVDVYEIGYAGYDLADQLHLIHQYPKFFALIDYVIIGLDFNTDLSRGTYEVVQDRMRLESAKFKAMRQIKLLVYFQNIGAFDAPRELVRNLLSGSEPVVVKKTAEEIQLQEVQLQQQRFENFKRLVAVYGFDKERFVFLIDTSKTPQLLLDYLHEQGYRYIDYSERLNQSVLPTTLIYDQHWNNHGRSIVASLIADYYKKNRLCCL